MNIKATFTTHITSEKSLAAFLLLSLLSFLHFPTFLHPFLPPSTCIHLLSTYYVLDIVLGTAVKEIERSPTLASQSSSQSGVIKVCTQVITR